MLTAASTTMIWVKILVVSVIRWRMSHFTALHYCPIITTILNSM